MVYSWPVRDTVVGAITVAGPDKVRGGMGRVWRLEVGGRALCEITKAEGVEEPQIYASGERLIPPYSRSGRTRLLVTSGRLNYYFCT